MSLLPGDVYVKTEGDNLLIFDYVSLDSSMWKNGRMMYTYTMRLREKKSRFGVVSVVGK